MTALIMLLAALAHADWKVEACKKACIPPHDAAVIACKTVATKDAGCERRADRDRAECEASCAKPKKAPAKKKSKPSGAAPLPGGPGKV